MCVPVRAQNTTYNIQHFNSENGVPNTIKGMQMDKNGFVWLATESGLVRYDGTAFKLYDHAETGATVNRLWLIGADIHGNIFTQVESQKYYYVTPDNTLRSITQQALFAHDTTFRFQPSIPTRIADVCQAKFLAHEIESWAVPEPKKIARGYDNSVPARTSTTSR